MAPAARPDAVALASSSLATTTFFAPASVLPSLSSQQRHGRINLLAQAERTASSPQRQLTRFELSRYLDYCTELLSLSSKLAATHAQCMDDPVVLDAVNDIEILASNLSNKIWQKIVILDTIAGLD